MLIFPISHCSVANGLFLFDSHNTNFKCFITIITYSRDVFLNPAMWLIWFYYGYNIPVYTFYSLLFPSIILYSRIRGEFNTPQNKTSSCKLALTCVRLSLYLYDSLIIYYSLRRRLFLNGPYSTISDLPLFCRKTEFTVPKTSIGRYYYGLEVPIRYVIIQKL